MRCETSIIESPNDAAVNVSERARRRMLAVRGEPLFFADWLDVVFIHYEVPAAVLQRHVPYSLELFDGKAYLSLVAFTMRGMRPCRGGRVSEWLLKPVANNDYLNVRTYVRHQGEAGIYFLREWMNNPFSLGLGAITFGLPYHFGKLNYQNRPATGFVRGSVFEKIPGPSFTYEAAIPEPRFGPCPAGSLDEFLLELYTAFTAHRTKRRFFRIWHQRWAQRSIHVSVSDKSLLTNVYPWLSGAKLVGANYSRGAYDVWMGCPHKIIDSHKREHRNRAHINFWNTQI